jgi:hypothetical protein
LHSTGGLCSTWLDTLCWGRTRDGKLRTIGREEGNIHYSICGHVSSPDLGLVYLLPCIMIVVEEAARSHFFLSES